jgi:hypothetical protein
MSDATPNATSRRRFLGGAAAVGLAAAVVPGPAGAARTAPRARAAVSVPPRYQLELGAQQALVTGVEGGDAYGEVAVTADPALRQKKHITKMRYQAIKFDVGLGMSKALSDSIRRTFDGRQPRMDGAVVEADFDLNAVERREFTRALITEVGFPALDGASKDAALLTVEVAPETVRFAPGKGKVQAPLTKSKAWLASNFRFELDGIDTARVSRIDPFVLKQAVTESAGASRDPLVQPGRIEVPNLTVTFSGPPPDDLITWHDDFLVRGNSGDDREKKGAIVFLAPDLKQELGRVELANVGIFELARSTDASGIKRFTASLYVEEMRFVLDDVDA